MMHDNECRGTGWSLENGLFFDLLTVSPQQQLIVQIMWSIEISMDGPNVIPPLPFSLAMKFMGQQRTLMMDIIWFISMPCLSSRPILHNNLKSDLLQLPMAISPDQKNKTTDFWDHNTFTDAIGTLFGSHWFTAAQWQHSCNTLTKNMHIYLQTAATRTEVRSQISNRHYAVNTLPTKLAMVSNSCKRPVFQGLSQITRAFPNLYY